MDNLKNILVSKLRNKDTSRAEFRDATDKLTFILVNETFQYLNVKTNTIETPTGTSENYYFDEEVVLVPILRSGLAFLPVFTKFFADAPVGVIGLRRDEITKIANLYYKKMPKIEKNTKVILLDPMIATGGTGVDALQILIESGAAQENIIYVCIICAKQGINNVLSKFPKIKIIWAVQDEQLNDQKYIVPGLGDFGNRYYF